MQLLTALPSSLAAGTTVTYRRTVSSYPATDGWALTLYLAGKSVMTTTATPNGADYDVGLVAAATAALEPGTYTWVERVSKASEKHDVGRGILLVLPDIATATPGSLQSWEEKELAQVESAIDSLLKSGISSYQIGGRAVKKQDLPVLMQIRASLLATLRRRRTGRLGQTVHVQFRPPGS